MVSESRAPEITTDQPWAEPVRGSWIALDPADGILLARNGQGCEIVVNPAEDSAVHQAAKFLSRDIKAISDYEPHIVPKPTPGAVSIHLITLGNVPLPDSIAQAQLKDKWEAFQILTTPSDIYLVGSSFRGAAFAAYTLSERLGIDPLYHWTGYLPEHHDPLVLKPINYLSGPPTFKYRGTFHDDEDILPRPFDQYGYPLKSGGEIAMEWYERYFETALRLRMNMVAPYTRVRRRFEVQKTASDWGLYYTSHHYDVLLSNPYGMHRFGLAEERDVNPVWDWFTNREGMLGYWRGGVMENRDLHCVWPVGLRSSMEDLRYEFPKNMPEEKKYQAFQEVIQEQVRLVKDLNPPDRDPLYHFTIYGEMLELYQKGTFQIPPEVILVWPDNCFGRMPALPTANGHAKNGVYYHLAFAPSTLQITHAVPRSLIAEQFRNIVDAGATEFMLVNVSEERETVKELRMISDICWNAPAALAFPDPADQFINWWSQEYFGKCAKLPSLPSKWGRLPSLPSESVNDLPDASAEAAEACRWYDQLIDGQHQLRHASDIIHTQLDSLQKKLAAQPYEPTPPDQIETLQKRNADFEVAMPILNHAPQKMTRPQRQFFHDNVALGLLISHRHTQAALHLHEALLAPDLDQAWQQIEAAREPLEKLEVKILRAEHPPFEQWYRETWLRSQNSPFNVHRPYRELRAFISSEGRDQLPQLGRTDVF